MFYGASYVFIHIFVYPCFLVRMLAMQYPGGKDEYRLLNDTSLKSQQVVINLKDYPSSFYKIVLEGKDNIVNCWIPETKEK